jgi:hypothetical protein
MVKKIFLIDFIMVRRYRTKRFFIKIILGFILRINNFSSGRKVSGSENKSVMSFMKLVKNSLVLFLISQSLFEFRIK